MRIARHLSTPISVLSKSEKGNTSQDQLAHLFLKYAKIKKGMLFPSKKLQYNLKKHTSFSQHTKRSIASCLRILNEHPKKNNISGQEILELLDLPIECLKTPVLERINKSSDEEYKKILQSIRKGKLTVFIKTLHNKAAIQRFCRYLPASKIVFSYKKMSQEQKKQCLDSLGPKQAKVLSQKLDKKTKEQLLLNLKYQELSCLDPYHNSYLQLALAAQESSLRTSLRASTSYMSHQQIESFIQYIPPDEIHDFVDCLEPNRLIAIIKELTPAQCGETLMCIGETSLLILVPHCSLEQICHSVVLFEENILHKVYDVMSPSQIKACFSVLRKEQIDSLKEPFLLLGDDEELVTIEIIQKASAASLAAAFLCKDERKLLKKNLSKISILTLSLAAKALPLAILLNILEDASEDQRKACFLHLEDADKDLKQELFRYSKEAKKLWKNSEEKIKSCKLLQKEIDRSLLKISKYRQQNAQELSKKIHKLWIAYSESFKDLKKLQEKTNLMHLLSQHLRFEEDFLCRFPFYNQLGDQLNWIREKMSQCSCELKDSVSQVLEQKLRKFQISTDEAKGPTCIEYQSDLMDQYQALKSSLAEFDIDESDLNENYISWEELLQAGLYTTKDLKRHSIDDITSLCKFIQTMG